MNIIFLDIDGVLNSEEFAERHYKETGKGLFMYDFLDPFAVDSMKKFLDKHPDIRLVISSSWRYGDVHNTVDFFRSNGMSPLADYVIGETPRSYSMERGKEIQWFLEHIGTDVMGDFIIDNDIKIDRYVIVDDEDFDMLDFQKENHIVKIDRLYGITNDDYDKIEKILYG